jgi:DNA (cytosine-5)-methyltransferase 1
MPDFISLFSGGGGADIGAMLAGYTPVMWNEYDPKIATVYIQNIGDHIRIGDILDQDPRDYPACDLLHASPPCPNFSVAKAGMKESPHDIALAEKVAEFIRVLAPCSVTLENVAAYRKSKSYQIVLKAITDGGYMYDAQILNSADYGVPQTRRRFIVRATKGLLRAMPESVPWVGWYAAIEDLLDTLPDSHFAEWQLKRLPDELKYRAFISRPHMGNPAQERGAGFYEDSHPTPTVMTRNDVQRAFIVDGQNGTVAHGVPTNRNSDDPMFTVSGSNFKAPIRSILECGRVVSMTPHALARFQSFPDWYQLPKNKALACKIIGDACPPLMMQAVFESLQPVPARAGE